VIEAHRARTSGGDCRPSTADPSPADGRSLAGLASVRDVVRDHSNEADTSSTSTAAAPASGRIRILPAGCTVPGGHDDGDAVRSPGALRQRAVANLAALAAWWARPLTFAGTMSNRASDGCLPLAVLVATTSRRCRRGRGTNARRIRSSPATWRPAAEGAPDRAEEPNR
jgi:hypothetical protein